MTSTVALFNVTVQPSGRSFQVGAGEAILAAGIRQGIGLPYGCRDGACGSCKCKLVSGHVAHGLDQRHAVVTRDVDVFHRLGEDRKSVV